MQHSSRPIPAGRGRAPGRCLERAGAERRLWRFADGPSWYGRSVPHPPVFRPASAGVACGKSAGQPHRGSSPAVPVCRGEYRTGRGSLVLRRPAHRRCARVLRGPWPAAPVRINGEHFLDGGLVDSIPVGRAVELGARTIYVLQVGRIDRSLRVPRQPWEVAAVAFEIARRHRYERSMAGLPDDVTVHVLPTGTPSPDYADIRQHLQYRNASLTRSRIDGAYRAPALPCSPSWRR